MQSIQMCRRSFSMVLLLLFLHLLLLVDATKGLNELRLQLIADEITSSDCEILMQRIYQNSHKEIESRLLKTPSCFEMLKHWTENEGVEETFLSVLDELKILGYNYLSDKISKAAFHEQSIKVRRFFLSETFSANHNEDSIIKDDSYRFQFPKKSPFPEMGSQASASFTCVRMLEILLVIFGFLLIIYLTLKFSPYVRKHINHTVRDITTV